MVAFLKYKKEELAFYRDLYTFVELTQVYPLLDKSVDFSLLSAFAYITID